MQYTLDNHIGPLNGSKVAISTTSKREFDKLYRDVNKLRQPLSSNTFIVLSDKLPKNSSYTAEDFSKVSHGSKRLVVIKDENAGTTRAVTADMLTLA
jgi:hypothetical protein